MFDVSELLVCPYCKTKLDLICPLIVCRECERIYSHAYDMWYMYDPTQEHWQKCKSQIEALFRLIYQDGWQPRHDNLDYPYVSVETAGIDQKANAAMLNVAKDIIGERMYEGTGYALDITAYNGWCSFQLAKHKKVVAVDISDHPCYGMGSVPRDVGLGIEKIIADGCYLPLEENSFDIVIMVAGLHHMHDKVLALNEAYRVLRSDGIFVAIGDTPMPTEQLDYFNKERNPDITQYEGLAYDEGQFTGWLAKSDFKSLEVVPIKYTAHMHDLGYFSLVKNPRDNIILWGTK